MWNSRRRLLTGGALAVLTALAACALLLVMHPGPREVPRGKLDLRDGILFVRGERQPFDGLLVESFPGGRRKLAIEIRAGRAHGLSRGWFENGQLEVEEHFDSGFSDGVRTRWYENGRVRSTAPIAHGRISGLYKEWHPNGLEALEIPFRDGRPDGEARAWAEDGSAKPPRLYRNGAPVATDAD